MIVLRWQRWRRDALAALAGALLAGAVLGPMSWHCFRVERQRAESAEQQRDEYRTKMEEEARFREYLAVLIYNPH